MNKRRQQSFWQRNYWVAIVVIVALSGMVLRQPAWWDFWSGLGYEPDATTAEIEDALELTGKGRRIFAATRPVVEQSAEFNEHCNSHNADVSLLGCYTDGKIYVYEITAEQLTAANKVTAAHELLHAVWERMSGVERYQLESLLRAVYMDNQDWFDEELESYDEDERLEEIYARAGTKLAEVPEELEEHYAKIFQNRAKIVAYYQAYEAPFKVLQKEIEDLEKKITATRDEIERERAAYTLAVEELDGKVDQFNICADLPGCFRTEAEFRRQRNNLLAEREDLEKQREQLNEKITQNNQRVQDYLDKRTALGELSDALNSNIEPVVEK